MQGVLGKETKIPLLEPRINISRFLENLLLSFSASHSFVLSLGLVSRFQSFSSFLILLLFVQDTLSIG